MSKVHIVIPNYNHYELINQLLFSLYKYEIDNIDSVLVVDDCSTDEEVYTGLNWWKQSMFPIEIFECENNLGFLLTANTGLKLVGIYEPTDIVILLSTDVKISGKFIEQIKTLIDKSTQNSLVGGVVYTHDTGWNTFNGKTFPYAEGWLLATTVAGWKDLGYLDERYAPNDFEDVDLSTTAISKGCQLVALNNPNIHHMGGQTIGYNPERQALTERNRKKFKSKWVK